MKKVVHYISVLNGLVQDVRSAFLSVDDLPDQSAVVGGTYYGLNVSNKGVITSTQGLTLGVMPPRTLFTDYATVGTSGSTETDLMTHTIAAGQLAANGDSLDLRFGGNFVGDASLTRRVRLYFGGTAILDTTAMAVTTSNGWSLAGRIVRVSATVIRFTGLLATTYASAAGKPNANNTAVSTELTGLTLSGTNVLKVTGQCQAGSADSDITGESGVICYWPA